MFLTLKRLGTLLSDADVFDVNCVRCEDSKYDLSLVGGEPLFRSEGWGYASRFYVQLEHENDEHVEEELWKLLFWKAKLKVLFIYDWTDKTQREQERKGYKVWLHSKLSSLQHMLNRHVADQLDGIDDGNDYLIVVGNRRDEYTNITKWRFFRLTAIDCQELVECMWEAPQAEGSRLDVLPPRDALI